MGGASPDATQFSYQMSLKRSAVSAGFCVTHSTEDALCMWSTQEFSSCPLRVSLGERFLCSTFSRRNTCLLFFRLFFCSRSSPFAKPMVCLGFVGIGILRGLGTAAFHSELLLTLLSSGTHWLFRHTVLCLFPDFWKHSKPEKAGTCPPQKQVFKGAVKAVYVKDFKKIFCMFPLC